MRVAGESLNFGTEQEHLNNVFGARLRITALRAAKGPGIEFLEYLTPRDGGPMPLDARASDLLHWQTVLEAADLEGVARKVEAGHYAFGSPGVGERGERMSLGKSSLVQIQASRQVGAHRGAEL